MSAATMRPTRHPVIGVLRPWPLTLLWPELDTGFQQYETPTVEGLAQVRDAQGSRLDLLVITARRPGRGDGGRFLAACLAAYRTVVVWEISNPRLADMLCRRGFRPWTELRDGERSVGMRWDRPSSPASGATP